MPPTFAPAAQSARKQAGRDESRPYDIVRTKTGDCDRAEPVGDAKHRFASEPRSGDVEQFIAPATHPALPQSVTCHAAGGISRRAVAFRIALHEQEARDVPEWVQLLPAGLFGGRDGRGPYLLDETAVLRAFSAGGMDLPVDYEHQTLEASERKGPVPAAGWIEALEVRGGELWARVSWTPRAAELIAAREYRYLSPVFRHDEGGRIVRIEGAALTHYPNLDLAPVAHSCNGGIPVNQKLEQCTEPETVDAHAPVGANNHLPPQADAQKVGAHTTQPDPEAALIAAHTAVRDELAMLKAKIAAEAAEAAVVQAMSEGKVPPALKAWATAYAAADPAGFAEYVQAAPAFTAAHSAQHVNQNDGTALSEEDRAACALLGISEADFAAHKQKTTA